MLEVKIVRVGIEVNSQLPMVVLKEKEEGKTFSLSVGLFELKAIAFALQNVKPSRPLIHDLTKSLIEALHGKIEKVVMTDLVNNTLYARIILREERRSLEVDSRPSDAIALALRSRVPIFITGKALNKMTALISNKEAEDFKKKLKGLNPGDSIG